MKFKVFYDKGLFDEIEKNGTKDCDPAYFDANKFVEIASKKFDMKIGHLVVEKTKNKLGEGGLLILDGSNRDKAVMVEIMQQFQNEAHAMAGAEFEVEWQVKAPAGPAGPAA